MSFDCAHCGRAIVSRYDGRLLIQQRPVRLDRCVAFTLHTVCIKRWTCGETEAWLTLPMQALEVS